MGGFSATQFVKATIKITTQRNVIKPRDYSVSKLHAKPEHLSTN